MESSVKIFFPMWVAQDFLPTYLQNCLKKLNWILLTKYWGTEKLFIQESIFLKMMFEKYCSSILKTVFISELISYCQK